MWLYERERERELESSRREGVAGEGSYWPFLLFLWLVSWPWGSWQRWMGGWSCCHWCRTLIHWAVFRHKPVLGTKLLICRRSHEFPLVVMGGSARGPIQLAAGSPRVSSALVLPAPSRQGTPIGKFGQQLLQDSILSQLHKWGIYRVIYKLRDLGRLFTLVESQFSHLSSNISMMLLWWDELRLRHTKHLQPEGGYSLHPTPRVQRLLAGTCGTCVLLLCTCSPNLWVPRACRHGIDSVLQLCPGSLLLTAHHIFFLLSTFSFDLHTNPGR